MCASSQPVLLYTVLKSEWVNESEVLSKISKIVGIVYILAIFLCHSRQNSIMCGRGMKTIVKHMNCVPWNNVHDEIMWVDGQKKLAYSNVTTTFSDWPTVNLDQADTQKTRGTDIYTSNTIVHSWNSPQRWEEWQLGLFLLFKRFTFIVKC